MLGATVLLLDDLEDLNANRDEKDDQEGDDAQVQDAAEFFGTGFFGGRSQLFLNEER